VDAVQEDYEHRAEEELWASASFSDRETFGANHGLLLFGRRHPAVSSGVVIINIHGTAVEPRGLPLVYSVRASVAFHIWVRGFRSIKGTGSGCLVTCQSLADRIRLQRGPHPLSHQSIG
jgi:hypothetical protein